MSTGVVTTITTDWRGDTLAVDLIAAGLPVLTVDSFIDFDEDGGWLVVGDSDPIEYTGVAEAAGLQLVTLADPPTDTYEAGLPVVIWDPSVANGGAQVVEYVATVDLHDGSGSVDAVIPHGLVPASSVNYLIGASVRLEQSSDGDWFVGAVLGREAKLGDVDIIGARFLTSYDGQRVEVMPTSAGGAVLLYTDHADEAGAGFIGTTQVEVGALLALQTVVTGPQIVGGSLPILALTSTRTSGVHSNSVTVTADKLLLNGDRVETPNLYLTGGATTPNVANVRIGPGGQLLEVTSSERFKQDIEDAQVDRAAVLQIVGRTWRDKNEVEADPDATARYIGVIAEELDDLGLTDFVEYDDEGPRSVKYDRLTVALLAVAQDQEKRLARIEQALGL